MTNEQILTKFMQDHYSDERLAALLAHAQDGKLEFLSCCCFIGSVNADHALKSYDEFEGGHYAEAELLSGAMEAELAFMELGFIDEVGGASLRRTRLIPLILAEQARRDELRARERIAVESDALRANLEEPNVICAEMDLESVRVPAR